MADFTIVWRANYEKNPRVDHVSLPGDFVQEIVIRQCLDRMNKEENYTGDQEAKWHHGYEIFAVFSGHITPIKLDEIQ